jgi:hypothetical protein
VNWLDAGLVDGHDRCAALGAQQPSRNLRHATIRRVPRSAETAMLEYRIRMLGQTREDGFTVTRRDGDAWVWLPVRFPTYSAADQWITQQQENEFARVTRGVSERTD